MKTYLLETKYEFLKALRMPQYSLPTLLFPVAFYTFFGIVFSGRSVAKVQMAEYLLATYGAFGVMGAAFFGFGVSVAVERGQGWLEAKRTTPMPIASYFVAKLVMAMMFSAIIVLLLFGVAVLAGNVPLTLTTAAALFAILVPGSIAFCALGLAIGFFTGPNSAAPVVNLVYLPLAFLSGLWVPIQVLPDSLQKLAVWLPPYHLAQLALRAIGSPERQPVAVHVMAMVIAAVLFSATAYAGYRRDEGKLYG